MFFQLPARIRRVVRSGRSLLALGRAFGSDIYALACLEARRAVSAGMAVAGLGAASATLIATAWILLVLSLVAWLADRWQSWPAALLVVATALIVIAVPLAVGAARMTRRMTFPETRRRVDEIIRGP
ncbi:MAG: phage holin family protein [Casimicrobiaceae bacterium]